MLVEMLGIHVDTPFPDKKESGSDDMPGAKQQEDTVVNASREKSNPDADRLDIDKLRALGNLGFNAPELD